MINNNVEYLTEKDNDLFEFNSSEGTVYTTEYLFNVKNFIKNNVKQVCLIIGAAGSGKTTYVGNNIRGEHVVYAALTRKFFLIIFSYKLLRV